MPLSKEQLYEALVESGGVSAEEFNDAAKTREAQSQGIDGVLVSKGALQDDQAGQLIAAYYGVPFVNLRKANVSEETVSLIPESFARAQKIVPVEKKGQNIRVATQDPENPFTRALLEKYLRGHVEYVYATPRDIDGSLILFQQDPAKVFKKIVEGKHPGKAGNDRTVIDLVNAFFDYGHSTSASDIHIEPEDEYVSIRFRIDGILKDIVDIDIEFHEPIITRLKVLSRLATDVHRAAQDGKISYKSHAGEDVEIRLSIVPTTHGEKAVMRLLSEKSRQYSLSNLGMSADQLTKFQEAIKRPWGMILVTGPTGSGKSTSLYSAMKLLNTRKVNISTIEDPVEYDMEGVNQIQVNEKTDLTFAKGLRSLVRQDPDIIMVGEIRDGETADIAINAAMTGHLVLSTLHTNDAPTAFPRLQDMGVENFLIASTVVQVIAQRLVRKVCAHCIGSYTLKKKDLAILQGLPEVKDRFMKILGKKSAANVRLFKGKGCAVCHHTGYRGRSGIFEVLDISDAVREAIMQNKNADEIREIAVGEGMQTMLEDGLQKVVLGETTIEEVLRVTQE